MPATVKSWCIRSIDGTWCATYRGTSPDKDAISDRTACGYYISLRVGSRMGVPTCPRCLAVIARRNRARAAAAKGAP